MGQFLELQYRVRVWRRVKWVKTVFCVVSYLYNDCKTIIWAYTYQFYLLWNIAKKKREIPISNTDFL